MQDAAVGDAEQLGRCREVEPAHRLLQPPPAPLPDPVGEEERGLHAGPLARRDERTRARSSATLVAQIGRIGHDVAADAGLKWSQVTHATVGNPGVLDPSRGQLSLAPNLPGWGKPGLVEAIRDELGTRTSFENDVNLAALGERALGAGRGVGDFCFLWIGTGVGLGIVIGGELHRGAAGAAGEIGYLPLGAGDPHDPAVRRRGLLEESASGAAVVRAAREAGVQVRTPKAVFAAARRGEPAACARSTSRLRGSRLRSRRWRPCSIRSS